MRFNIVTLFPEFFDSPLKAGLLGRAVASGLISFDFRNPRDFSTDKHRHVDDTPYGGGPGMVMQAGPVAAALDSIRDHGRLIMLTPQGKQLTTRKAARLAREDILTLICGRYEGIDQRISDLYQPEEISLGDVILNGGETAALALIEAVARFCPGFLGKSESASEESFSSNLIEYPHYTRPEVFRELSVPQILASGNHAQIAAWRRQRAVIKTFRNRPDLLAKANLDSKDAESLAKLAHTRPGRNLGFCLMHSPIRLENGKTGVSSLTNLDIHDIARISRSYGMAAFYALTPIPEQLDLLRKILDHWQSGSNVDRSRALEIVRPVASFEEMKEQAEKLHGVAPVCLATSAQWPKRGKKALSPADALQILRKRPVVICLGTARGLAREAIKLCDGQLKPLRFLGDNHLSVRSAAAILADRILGDFY